MDSENYAIEAIDSLKKAEEEFPVTGDLGEIVPSIKTLMNFYLLKLYSECTYMYYEARDLENALFYMEQAEKNFAFLNGSDAYAFIIKTFKDEIKYQKSRLNEVKAFIDSRYQENNDNRKMRPRDPKINAA